MTAPQRLLTLTFVTAIAGCATLGVARSPDQDADLRLDRGLAALDDGLYRDAFTDLAWVYAQCPDRQAGTRALAGLAALELDGRNPRARPAVGAELVGRMIRDPGVPAWVRPLVETTYLAALALGAPPPEGTEATPADEAARPGVEPAATDDPDAEDPAADDREVKGAAVPAPVATEVAAARSGERAYGCGPAVAIDGWVPPALPTLPGPSMAAMLSRSEGARDSLALRAETLRLELTTVRAQLAATQAELERIRRTLSP